MNKFPVGLSLAVVIALQGTVGTVSAQDTRGQTTPTPRAGAECHPFTNHQASAAVTAREVMLTERGRPWLVVFK